MRGITKLYKMKKEEFRETFKKYKEGFDYNCSIEKYQYVIPESHFMLDSHFDNVKKDLEKTLDENKSPEIFEPLKELNESIYREYLKARSSSEKYARKSEKQYNKILAIIHPQLLFWSEKIGEFSGVKQQPEIKKPKLSEYNKPVINKRQVLALMKLFRDHKLVNKELTDTALAECFGTLTGYVGNQLRKDFSEYNKGEIYFKEEEVDTLNDILLNMSKDLSNLPLK